MRRIAISAAGLLALAAAPAVAAAGEPDAQLWTTAIANGPVAGDFAAWVEVQARIGDDVSQLRQSKVRVALGYRFSDALTVYGGYAFVTSHRSPAADATEHRIWQQASYSVGSLGPARVTGRTRLEQRSFEGSVDVGWRLRQQMRVGLPLTAGRGVSLTGSVELLIALNDADWGSRQGLDQVRGFAGIGVPLGSKQAIEAGYLHQRVQRSGEQEQVNHVGVVTIAHRF